MSIQHTKRRGEHWQADEEQDKLTVTSAAILNGLKSRTDHVSQMGRMEKRKRPRTDVVIIPVVTVSMITFVRKSSCFGSPERALYKCAATVTERIRVGEESLFNLRVLKGLREFLSLLSQRWLTGSKFPSEIMPCFSAK